jgi:alkylated DNA repair protein alkB family protein 7
MSGLSGLSIMRQMARASTQAKNYSTKLPQSLNLTSTSPLVRPLAGPSDAIDHEAIQRDFKFWPSFFTEEESSEILQMALWKLDRADTTRRRRKRKGDQNPVAATGLQGLFEGEYGFEEVSLRSSSVMHNM